MRFSVPNCEPFSTMHLSSPNFLQNATSMSRRPATQVAKDWIGRSVQAKSREGLSKAVFETPHPRSEETKGVRTYNFGIPTLRLQIWLSSRWALIMMQQSLTRTFVDREERDEQ